MLICKFICSNGTERNFYDISYPDISALKQILIEEFVQCFKRDQKEFVLFPVSSIEEIHVKIVEDSDNGK